MDFEINFNLVRIPEKREQFLILFLNKLYSLYQIDAPDLFFMGRLK